MILCWVRSCRHVGAHAFNHCPLLESITIPYAAINNPNYGMYNGDYCDPFRYCTRLIAISAEFNMTVVEYLRHLAQVKEDRIRLRVWMLICLKRINDKRISDSEEGKLREER